MKKEEWDEAIKGFYNNLNKEQFELLLDNSLKMIIKKLFGEYWPERIKGLNNPEQVFDIIEEHEFDNHLEGLARDIFLTVKNSKRISFKQFKVLSAFAKMNWLEEDVTEEFKQF